MMTWKRISKFIWRNKKRDINVYIFRDGRGYGIQIDPRNKRGSPIFIGVEEMPMNKATKVAENWIAQHPNG